MKKPDAALAAARSMYCVFFKHQQPNESLDVYERELQSALPCARSRALLLLSKQLQCVRGPAQVDVAAGRAQRRAVGARARPGQHVHRGGAYLPLARRWVRWGGANCSSALCAAQLAEALVSWAPWTVGRQRLDWELAEALQLTSKWRKPCADLPLAELGAERDDHGLGLLETLVAVRGM